MRVSMPSEVFALGKQSGCSSLAVRGAQSVVVNFATSSMTRRLLPYFFRVVFVEVFS